jgi:hypothetical protein
MIEENNLQKNPIPIGLIGSAIEILAIIVKAFSERSGLKARVALLENTDITQGNQLVIAERERDELRETMRDLQKQITLLKNR